jgi:hypothetical protein
MLVGVENERANGENDARDLQNEARWGCARWSCGSEMNSVSFKTMLARVKSKHASIEMKRARVEAMLARMEMKRAMIKTVAVRHPGGDSLLYGL